MKLTFTLKCLILLSLIVFSLGIYSEIKSVNITESQSNKLSIDKPISLALIRESIIIDSDEDYPLKTGYSNIVSIITTMFFVTLISRRHLRIRRKKRCP